MKGCRKIRDADPLEGVWSIQKSNIYYVPRSGIVLRILGIRKLHVKLEIAQRSCTILRHLCNLEIVHAVSANFIMSDLSCSWLPLVELVAVFGGMRVRYRSHERSKTVLTKLGSTLAYRGPGTKL